MNPSDLIRYGITLFVFAPVVAVILAFRAQEGLRRVARWYLFVAFCAYAAGTIGCLRPGFRGKPSSGIGNGVFVILAIPLAAIGAVLFAFWRAACRHDYEQGLPPDLRRIAELEDFDRAREIVLSQLAKARRRIDSWFISGEQRQNLRSDIVQLETALANIETERAKRI